MTGPVSPMPHLTYRSGWCHRLVSYPLLTGLILLVCSACQSYPPSQSIPPSAQTGQANPAPVNAPTQVNSPPQVNTYDLALDKEASATSITKTAQSEEDWNLVADQWIQAIDLMKRVPRSSPNQTVARQKVAEYERQLIYAKKQALRLSRVTTPPPSLSSVSSSSLSSTTTQAGGVYRARITRRAGSTPVIEVTFNGKYRFEMVVDTGASATVITQEMANSLGVVPTDMAMVDTASARNMQIPIGIVNSVEAGGLISQNVQVMIAGPELEIGLLGHNFYGNYDITIKQDVVEFVPR